MSDSAQAAGCGNHLVRSVGRASASVEIGERHPGPISAFVGSPVGEGSRDVAVHPETPLSALARMIDHFSDTDALSVGRSRRPGLERREFNAPPALEVVDPDAEWGEPPSITPPKHPVQVIDRPPQPRSIPLRPTAVSCRLRFA
jgi:hypothetical protein